jgi:hypothetical protein
VYETELRLSRQRWLPNLRHNFCLFLDTPFRPVDPVGSCRSNYDNIEAALDTLMEDMRNSQCFAMRARPNVVSETVAIDHHLCSPVRPSANVDPAHDACYVRLVNIGTCETGLQRDGLRTSLQSFTSLLASRL